MHPRIVFPSIEVALKASPFFIDEEGVGPWLSSDDEALYAFGRVIHSTRNAIHIPSLEQSGAIIPEVVIADFCQRAAGIGLSQLSDAVGYWTLAATGVVQKEKVKIAFSDDSVDVVALRHLAQEIILATNQEAVAIEVGGKVEHLFWGNRRECY
jgi:hypothetical protein